MNTMKRKVASRKLKRPCISCNHAFLKGEVYYNHRQVFTEEDKVYAYEYLICPKCKYKQEQHNHRYLNFTRVGICRHPITAMVYMPIPGEPVVQQPSHEECQICKGHV